MTFPGLAKTRTPRQGGKRTVEVGAFSAHHQEFLNFESVWAIGDVL